MVRPDRWHCRRGICWRDLGMGEGVHRMLTRLVQIAAGGVSIPATVWIYAMFLEVL